MLSRRNFLNRTLGAGACAGLGLTTQGVRPSGAQTPGAQAPTAAPEPKFLAPAQRPLIVDSQVHLWLPQAPDRPWPADGPARAHLPNGFTYDVLLPMMDEAGVDRVVIVPPSWEGERNDYAIEAATKFPNRFAFMGRIQLNSPQAPALMPKFLWQTGILGIRLTFNGAQSSWLTDGTADWFWPEAAKYRIPVMTPTSGRAPEFLRIVERSPDLIFIIDHMGISEEIAKAGKLAEAVEQTVAFAKHRNVSVKLSSVPTKSAEPYPFGDMTPHLRRVFDAFGPQRCYWGTDFTAAPNKSTYSQRVTHFTETLDFLSRGDKYWVMGQAILARLKWI
jgi:predicted TIM-barrel fold metal-dependent hydrolase